MGCLHRLLTLLLLLLLIQGRLARVSLSTAASDAAEVAPLDARSESDLVCYGMVWYGMFDTFLSLSLFPCLLSARRSTRRSIDRPTMHTLTNRANALLTFAGTALAFLAALASVSDIFHSSSPDIDLRLDAVERLVDNGRHNDEARITMSLDANFSSSFSWNTKQLFVFICVEYTTSKHKLGQVSVWDKIITSPDQAVLSLRGLGNKYQLVDQGHRLRGTDFNMTVYWNVMPRVGYLYTRSKTFTGFSFPQSYI